MWCPASFLALCCVWIIFNFVEHETVHPSIHPFFYVIFLCNWTGHQPFTPLDNLVFNEPNFHVCMMTTEAGAHGEIPMQARRRRCQLHTGRPEPTFEPRSCNCEADVFANDSSFSSRDFYQEYKGESISYTEKRTLQRVDDFTNQENMFVLYWVVWLRYFQVPFMSIISLYSIKSRQIQKHLQRKKKSLLYLHIY